MVPRFSLVEYHAVVATPKAVTHNWLSTSPLTSRSHLVFDEINFDQSRNFNFYFKKNRQDLIGAKHTPGCAFLFFLQEKTLQRAMLGRCGRKAKAFALHCGHAKITHC